MDDRLASKRKTNPKNHQWGRIKNLKISTGENFDQTRAFVGVPISREAFEAIAH
jgi:aminoglycoside phosphotransferase family enzyme